MDLKRIGAATFLLTALLVLSFGSTPIRGAVDEMTGLFGGELRVAVMEDITLDPLTATSEASEKAISLVYDSIARIDADSLLPEPWAADGWTVDAEASSLTVDLRSDLMWHDGTPVLASEIAAAYEEYKVAGMVPSDLVVTAPSDVRLVFELPSGAGTFLTDGLTLPFFKTVGTDKVGSGPFIPPATVTMPLTLSQNAVHFSVPKLSSITYTTYADTAAASVALIKGDVDFIGWRLTPLDPTNIIVVDGRNTTLVNESAAVAIVSNPGLSLFFLGFNTSDPALNDARLRQAIAHGLNKELFLQIQPSVRDTSSLVAAANSPWFNSSVPTYDAGFTLVEGRSSVNVATSTLILDQAGYIDVDGDGFRDSPTGQAMSLTVLAPPFDEDIRLATIAGGFETAMSIAGLDVKVNFTARAERDQAVASGDFDMVFDTLMTDVNPGFISSLSWITNFGDSELNSVLSEADAAIDIGQRQQLVKDALGIVGERIPLAPAFFYDAIEAYNKTQLEGWVPMLGGVNNFWTYVSLHPARVGSLAAEVSIVPVSAISGDDVTALVKAVDQEGSAVADVTVRLQADGVEIATGMTDATGTASLTFSAPGVEGPADISITIQTIKAGYVGDQVTTAMTVRPVVGALVVSVASDKISIEPDEAASITVTVRDEAGAVVAGAKVSLGVIGLGGSLDNVEGTTGSAGTFTTSFSADVGVRTQFRITATASLSGFVDGTGSTSVLAEQRVGEVEPRLSPFFDVGAIVAAVVLLVVIVLFLAVRRR